MIKEISELMEVNSDAHVELHTVAHQHDLAIVDNLYSDWKKLAKAVGQLHFEPARGEFPGLRATLRTRTPSLDGLIVRTLASEHLLNIQDTIVFSLLAPISRFEEVQHVPHRDADVQISGVIYLCDSCAEGEGTGFYRHRTSGLQGGFLGDTRLEKAAQLSPFDTVDKFLDDLSLPGPGRSIYGAAPSLTWEVTHTVGLRPNRLVLFDSRLFHAALIPRSQSTRLTQNLFLRGQPVQAPVQFRG